MRVVEDSRKLSSGLAEKFGPEVGRSQSPGATLSIRFTSQSYIARPHQSLCLGSMARTPTARTVRTVPCSMFSCRPLPRGDYLGPAVLKPGTRPCTMSSSMPPSRRWAAGGMSDRRTRSVSPRREMYWTFMTRSPRCSRCRMTLRTLTDCTDCLRVRTSPRCRRRWPSG